MLILVAVSLSAIACTSIVLIPPLLDSFYAPSNQELPEQVSAAERDVIRLQYDVVDDRAAAELPVSYVYPEERIEHESSRHRSTTGCRRTKPAAHRLCSHRGNSNNLCLRQVDQFSKHQHHKSSSAEWPTNQGGPTRLSAEMRRHIAAVPGRNLDRRGHLGGLPAVSDMQQSMSVRGSVGQLGNAGIGKMTALLAQLVDRDNGEDLFVVDPFNASAVATDGPPSVHGLSQFDQFTANVNHFNLDVVTTSTSVEDGNDDGSRSSDGDRQEESRSRSGAGHPVYVHRGTSSDWSAIDHSLTVWNVSQFRLVIVETKNDRTRPEDAVAVDAMTLRARFDLAVCMLRDGGLIGLDVSDGLNFDIVDGNDTGDSSRRQPGVAESLVNGFLERHGTDLIAPLVLIDDTLFLTTTNWRRKYAEHLHDWLHHHLSATVDDGSNRWQLRIEMARGFNVHTFYVVR